MTEHDGVHSAGIAADAQNAGVVTANGSGAARAAPTSGSLRAVADLLTVGVVVGDADGHAGFANEAWTRMTGQHALDWLGQGWLAVLPAHALEPERTTLVAALVRGETSDRRWQITHPDGRLLTLAVSIAAEVHHKATVGFVATVTDVTAVDAAAERLIHSAAHDQLTGLLNRSQANTLLHHALDRRRREPDAIVAVLFIDVDDLKATNDRHGHLAGDRLLQSLARRISDAVRPVDVVARWGGDEFLVIGEGLTHRDEATVIAQRIIDTSGAPVADEKQIGVSIGVAFSDDPLGAPEDLISAADQAMYYAKQRGGSGYHVANEIDDEPRPNDERRSGPIAGGAAHRAF